MIISHRNKFAYFRVPKTGSSGMSFMLRMLPVWNEEDIMTPVHNGGWPGYNVPKMPDGMTVNEERRLIPEQDRVINHMHLTPEMAIEAGYITQEQLEEYNVFIACREPCARYVSMFKHKYRRLPVVEQFVEGVDNGEDFHLLERRTTAYAYSNGVLVADVLDFSNYANEVRRMLATLSDLQFPIIPHINRRRVPAINGGLLTEDDYYTEALREKVREKFSGDVDLYNGMKAGTLPSPITTP